VVPQNPQVNQMAVKLQPSTAILPQVNHGLAEAKRQNGLMEKTALNS
jgi:hypothetical protein